MNYKNYDSNNEVSGKGLLVMFIIVVFILIGVITLTNSCSASDWNDGRCPECDVRYELRAASNALKYYTCPECGKEVNRY